MASDFRKKVIRVVEEASHEVLALIWDLKVAGQLWVHPDFWWAMVHRALKENLMPAEDAAYWLEAK